MNAPAPDSAARAASRAQRVEADLLAKQAVAAVEQLGQELPGDVKARIYEDVVRELAIKAGLRPRDASASAGGSDGSVSD